MLCPLIGISFLDIARATTRSVAATACTLVPTVAVAQVATGRVGSAAGGLVLIALTATAGWSAAIVVADHPLKGELLILGCKGVRHASDRETPLIVLAS